MSYTQHYNKRETPQSEPVHGKNMVENSAGGFAFQVDKWTQLERFLILGSMGGTYYISEKKLTKDNAHAIEACIAEDGKRVVDIIVDISDKGRAPNNDPALFALAVCAGADKPAVRKYALENLNKVARIGTHLFHFAEYVQAMRGWGRGLREGFAKWYNEKSIDSLAYQVIKYRQRDGWTHRDILRKAHPVTTEPARQALYRWIVAGNPGLDHRFIKRGEVTSEYGTVDDIPELISAFEQAQTTIDKHKLANLIIDHRLPREAIPTEFLNEPVIWEALLENMPMTALIRNLGVMTSNGVLESMGANTKKVVDQLSNEEAIRKARVHPIQVLSALTIYGNGAGFRGNLQWSPIGSIVDALDEAFYISFGNVEPTGKRTMLALDVSGSMSQGCVGLQHLSCAVASAAMAMVTARAEQDYMVTAFTNILKTLSITPRQRLDDIMKTANRLNFGSTDCSLPMVEALKRGWNIDTFIVYTDNETWAGIVHPFQALTKYREQTGIPAKLIVVGMSSNNFTIADPSDAGMLDVVGFDTSVPNIISDFSRS